jgi:hypothetical protein
MRIHTRIGFVLALVVALSACDEARGNSITAPDGVAPAMSLGGCYDPAGCTALGGAYISHFNAANCTGVESYYTPYFFYDGIRRSWDGGGVAGNTLYTITNYSYKDEWGNCYNAWPSGNTLSDFVLIYR